MKFATQSSVLLAAVLAWPAVAQESSRGDFIEFCQAMRGRWVGELTCVEDWAGFGKKGDKLAAHGEVTVTEDGNAVIDRFYAGNGSAMSVIAFDTGAKQIKAMFVSSGGGVDQSVFYKSDGRWVNKGAGSNHDGTTYEYISTIEITDNGNTQAWTRRTTVRGKLVGEQTDVWRRVSK